MLVRSKNTPTGLDSLSDNISDEFCVSDITEDEGQKLMLKLSLVLWPIIMLLMSCSGLYITSTKLTNLLGRQSKGNPNSITEN